MLTRLVKFETCQFKEVHGVGVRKDLVFDALRAFGQLAEFRLERLHQDVTDDLEKGRDHGFNLRFLFLLVWQPNVTVLNFVEADHCFLSDRKRSYVRFVIFFLLFYSASCRC